MFFLGFCTAITIVVSVLGINWITTLNIEPFLKVTIVMIILFMATLYGCIIVLIMQKYKEDEENSY